MDCVLKKIFHSAGVIGIIGFFACAQATAALAAGTSALSPSSVAVIADVNVRNATSAVEGKSIGVKFSISNDGQESQSDVKYGVELFKVQQDSSTELVDTYVADDMLSLSPGQTFQKSLSYTPPPFYAGQYQVWVVSKNSSGMPFSIVPAGDVTLTPSVTDNYVEIDPNQCDLVVTGSTTDMGVYNLDLGVDILPSEGLTLMCLATSHFSSPLSVGAKFQTFTRSQFGNLVSTDNPKQPANTLPPNQMQRVRFSVPRPQAPQSYDALLTLTGTAGATVSNTVLFHYVVRGNSGTIQNASLDKDSYAAGDVAKVGVTFTGSADNFLGARYAAPALSTQFQLAASIDGQGGVHCAQSTKQQVDSSNEIHASIPVNIASRCVNPVLTVDLTDGNGTVLDHKTYSVLTGGIASQTAGWPGAPIILIALGVLVLFLGAYFLPLYIRKSRPGPNKETGGENSGETIEKTNE